MRRAVERQEAICSALGAIEGSGVRLTVLELREALRGHPSIAGLRDPAQSIYQALLALERDGRVDRVRRDPGYEIGSGADEWGLR